MLSILKRIVQEVSASRNLSEALTIMVERVRQAIRTEACAVYLLDAAKQHYVLMAAVGFEPDTVGKISLRVDEGLIGLIGQREESINLENASEHPNFKFIPELGEGKYQAFLGVPIMHQGRILGVFIAQQRKKRRFDEDEEAFLITLSAQLAGVIAHAEATGLIHENSELNGERVPVMENMFQGLPGSGGVGIGIAHVVYPLSDLEKIPDKRIDDIESEIALFESALEAAQQEMWELSGELANVLPSEQHDLFEAYLRILDKHSLGAEVIRYIRQGEWAQGALRKVIFNYVRQFDEMEDDYLRERASDFKDIGRRVLTHLEAHNSDLRSYPERTILVGEEITASMLAEVPRDRLIAIVSLYGSNNSHVAILARAMGVAAVIGVEGLPLSRIDNIETIVDGYNGRVYFEPSIALRKEFIRLMQEERELYAGFAKLRDLPAKTLDEYEIVLQVNTGLVAEVANALEAGALGVGLYRTEVPFLIRDRFPSEEEQRIIYRQMMESFLPYKVTMRTLDVGGDKILPYFEHKEANPFLGWRGIRISLDHPEIFLLQMRAMLHASEGINNLRVMLPMVTSVEEVREASRLIEQAFTELTEEGCKLEYPQIGAMIEVPAAVYQTKAIAQLVDFVSVGTNDLTQYLLAVDRNNARVAGLYDSLHPAVLHALMHIVQAAHSENITAHVCGEMAGDPVAVMLLMAMGFDSLSMNATSVPKMKFVVRSVTMERAKQLLQDVMLMCDATEIRQHLEQALVEAGIGNLIRGRGKANG
jgi:phosphotransferase system enzyme I (PtsP)